MSQTLVSAAPENRVVREIISDPQHPRNSEGAFITLKSGRILFFYTQFYGGAKDASPARIVSIFSDDDGATWSEKAEVVVENKGHENVMSVSALRLRSGKIALVYLVKNSFHDCRPWIQFSSDEAQTWTAPKLIIDAPGYFVLNNDRVVQLGSGRLIVPVAFHRARGSDPQSQRTFDSRAIAMWFLSDDEGQTWHEADTWWAIPVESKSGLQEPGVVELSDGKIFGWARTDQGAQFGFASTNAGQIWSAPTPTELKSPNAPASIKRLPNSADLLAIFNDHSGKFPFTKNKRTPLVAAISSDGGKTWPTRKILETDPNGMFCYTAIHFLDNVVLLAYSDFHSGVLRIRCIDLDWLK